MTVEADTLREALLTGSRRALAKAVTLVESTHPDHRTAADALLEGLPAPSGTLRIGLSGTPGVGKSTFVEAFGMRLCERGTRLAVLAVDPSSARSGGSILGDKTRMEQLARHPNAFVRPTPSARALGGVAARTRAVIRMVEAAGFDTVIVETVGVGQSETEVAEMTDLFLLLLAPGGGDELQGIKRGVMECADLVVVNKADGALMAEAQRTAADYMGALRLMRRRRTDPEGFPKALTLSAVTGLGLDRLEEEMSALVAWRRESGVFDRLRVLQDRAWLDAELRALIDARLRDTALSELRTDLEAGLRAGTTTPRTAAERLANALFSSDQGRSA
ncbi:MAG: methylmalonyl Co-A mutase-associated GTPase MeaB [Pseudomonadota bacterium]